VARELGWLPSASGSETGQTANRPEEQNHSSNSISTNQAQVDFVDLRTAATNQAPNDAGVVSALTAEPASVSATSSLSASNAIPGFVSGTNTLLAFDSSVATPGSLITFWNTTPDQFNQALGSAVLGTNSLVVTIPFTTWGQNGATLTVTAVNSLGLSNVLGQLLPAVPGGP
jgi:hypothetical protein